MSSFILGPLRDRNCCCLWFWQVVLVFHCGLPRQIFPLPRITQSPLKQTCAPRLEKACKTVDFSQSNARSLSRAVVIKTKSLPISATTFPTALSLYIADDGRKHYISTIHHSPRKSMSYKFAAPRYRLPPMALQTVQVIVEPRLSTATHKAEMALNDRSVVS